MAAEADAASCLSSCTFYLTTLHDGSQLPESCPSATNERFRCADNVAALICLPPRSPPSLLSSLTPCPARSVASSSLLCVFRCLAFASLAAILASTNTNAVEEQLPLSLSTLPRSAYRIPAPIQIAIANRCQNASMQSAALRSCCLHLLSCSCSLQLPPPALPAAAAFLFLLQFNKLRCVARQAPRRTCCHLPHGCLRCRLCCCGKLSESVWVGPTASPIKMTKG